ncbi:hypothetical protein H8356DRAFT_1323908 [Neocallimastix lanati (nom. inval.)]|nr:hypothetical protein H8356DRAFT_1323908 [Neocallimastix sp. JGI-2020a]
MRNLSEPRDLSKMFKMSFKVWRENNNIINIAEDVFTNDIFENVINKVFEMTEYTSRHLKPEYIRQSPNPYHSNVLNYLDEWGQTLNDWSNLPRIKTVSNIRFQASMGDFSYWGNSLNFSNYQSKTSFNFFDYYDGKEVYKRYYI